MMTFSQSIACGCVRIQFSDKPAEPIRRMLKAHGFRWQPASREWMRPRVTGAADILATLDKMIGPRRPDGACWQCQNPAGYFRPQGAAMPVYCDLCHELHEAARATDGRTMDPMGVDAAYEDACRDACGL